MTANAMRRSQVVSPPASRRDQKPISKADLEHRERGFFISPLSEQMTEAEIQRVWRETD